MPNKSKYERLVVEGVCTSCKRVPAADGATKCLDCRERMRRNRLRAHERRLAEAREATKPRSARKTQGTTPKKKGKVQRAKIRR